jgi:MinD superfamily P-loop ATPase
MIPEPTEALPPCPLCGSDDLTEYHKDDPRNHCVACDRCEASAPFSAWNTREPEAGKLREAHVAFVDAVADGLSWNSSVIQCLDRISGLVVNERAALSRNQGR